MSTIIQIIIVALCCIAHIESIPPDAQLIKPYFFHQNGLPFHIYKKPINKNDFVPKIVGGVQAHGDNTKYQVSIRLKIAERVFGNGHICGGSLISYRTILTAAHCLYYFNEDGKDGALRSWSEFLIVMGAMNRFIRTTSTLSYTITEARYHADFNTEDMRNDIALMFLNGEVPANHPTVQPIAIATYAIRSGSICQINGWGTTAFQGSASNILLTANVTLFSTRACRKSYGDTLQSGMMCAGDWDGSFDACQGDSGGPLAYGNVLVGVVSWGNKCGSPGWPGIYTNITYYQDWIRKNSANHPKSTHFMMILCSLMLFLYSLSLK